MDVEGARDILIALGSGRARVKPAPRPAAKPAKPVAAAKPARAKLPPEERSRRASAAGHKRWAREGDRAARSALMRAKWKDPQFRDRALASWSTPEGKARRVAALQKGRNRWLAENKEKGIMTRLEECLEECRLIVSRGEGKMLRRATTNGKVEFIVGYYTRLDEWLMHGPPNVVLTMEVQTTPRGKFKEGFVISAKAGPSHRGSSLPSDLIKDRRRGAHETLAEVRKCIRASKLMRGHY